MRSATRSTASASSLYCASNMRCSVWNMGPVTFQWKLWVLRYSVYESASTRESPPAIAFFETRGTWLALFPREELAKDATVAAEGAGFRGFTLAHNVRSPEEADALIAQAVAAGATLVKAAHKTDWGGYSGYFADPDGFLWEVAHNPHFWIE